MFGSQSTSRNLFLDLALQECYNSDKFPAFDCNCQTINLTSAEGGRIGQYHPQKIGKKLQLEFILLIPCLAFDQYFDLSKPAFFLPFFFHLYISVASP